MAGQETSRPCHDAHRRSSSLSMRAAESVSLVGEDINSFPGHSRQIRVRFVGCSAQSTAGCDSAAPDEGMSFIHSSGSPHSDYVSGKET